jgi:DNA-binding XRE family transcriptional regulator
MQMTNNDEPQTTQTAPPIKPELFENLRNVLMLNVKDMASVLGVSRVTYYDWINGKQMRSSKAQEIRGTLRRIVSVIKDKNFPTSEVIKMSYKQRAHELKELLDQFD